MSGASANLRRHVQQLVEVHRTAALSDRQLLQRFAAQREEAAFALLVRRHGPMVLGLCRRVLDHEQDAEDVFQAAFLILARKAGAIRQTDVGGFLYRVAYRLAVRARGQAAKREQRVGAASRAAPGPARLAEPTSPDPLTDVTWREVRQLVDEELQRLPETLRSALVLCYLEGKTQEQAAALLGWSKSTLRRRLERGRELLRRHLLARGLAPAAALTATLFAEGTAPARVPAALADATVRGAVQADPLAPAVAALVEGGALLPAGKTKMALAILLAVGLLGGAGVWFSAKPPFQIPSGGLTPPETSEPRGADAPRSGSLQAASPKREAGKNVEIQGRVLDPAGKPKAGAKLLLLGKDKSTELGVSAADGRFTVAVPKEAKGHYLIAQADGTGLDFLDLPQSEAKKPVELRLVKDNPIRGRIVNTEGNPVAGVRVAVKRLDLYPSNSLDAFLAGWKERHFLKGIAGGEKRLRIEEAALLAVTTDAEGRFALHGVGEERLAFLRLCGGGIAEEQRTVVNRAGFDAKPYNQATRDNIPKEARRSILPMLLHGPDVSVVAGTEKPIRGVVKDADTGKGRAGAVVRTVVGQNLQAKTDARGRYKIRGARKAKMYVLEVAGDPSTGHMAAQAWADDTPGYRPIVADISVKKGVIVTGKVIDKSTGRPISGAAMAAVLIENPFVKDYPRFDSPAWLPTWEMAKDGVFRLVTLPGPVLLMGGPKDHETEFLYKPPFSDPKYPQYFKKLSSSSYYYGPNGVMLLLQGNYCKVLEIKADAKIVEQDIVLERASTVSVRIQDADGQALSGVWVAGNRPLDGYPAMQCKEAACTVYQVEPGKPRLLVFFDPVGKRAGTLPLKGDEKAPVVVKLGQFGALEGQLLDGNGKPLAGIAIEPRYRQRAASEVHRAVHPARQIVTDAKGMFAMDDLIPEQKLELSFRRGKHRFEPTAKLVETTFEVKPGETRDMGAIKLQRVAEKTEE